MEAKLICYTLGKISSSTRSQFKKKLSGYTDHSNKCKYKYKREGILGHLPNITPIRAVIIVRPEDEKIIIKFLRQYNAKYSTYDVKLKEKESKKLRKETKK